MLLTLRRHLHSTTAHLFAAILFCVVLGAGSGIAGADPGDEAATSKSDASDADRGDAAAGDQKEADKEQDTNNDGEAVVEIDPTTQSDDPNDTDNADDEEEEAASDQLELDEVVVTGTPVSRSRSSVPSDVDVVKGSEKRRRQSTSLGDSIDHLSGVDTLGTGPNAGLPVLRGFSGERVRVLMDGTPLDFQQWGVRHNPNIDPFIAEEIEVVRGAQSILYGSGALGGVVNILPTRPPTASDGEFEASGETTLGYESGFRLFTGAQKLSLAYGNFGVAGTFVGRYSEGLITPDGDEALDTGNPNDPFVTGKVPGTDFHQLNGDINVGYMTGIGQVSARYEAWRSPQNYVVPDPPPPNGNPLQPGAFGQDLQNDLAQLRADLVLDETWMIKPSFNFASNRRVAAPGPPEPVSRDELPGAKVIDIRRHNFTGRVELEHEGLFDLLSGRFGLEGLYVDQESSGETILSPGGQVQNYAAFIFEELDFDRLIVNIGGRLDYRSIALDLSQTTGQSDRLDGLDPGQEDNQYLTGTGSLGASYGIIADKLFVVGNLGRGFRAPTLFELYADGVHGGVSAVQQGNPDLEPETSITADGGLRWQSDRVSADVTGYYNSINDYLFLAGTGTNDPDSGLSIFDWSQQDAAVWGADLAFDVTPIDWLNLRGKVGYVDGELDDGTQVPLLPPVKLQGEVSLQQESLSVFEDVYLTVGGRYGGAQDSAGRSEPFFQFDAPPPPFGTASTGAYALLDVAAGATISATGTEIAIGAENLLNTEYRDFLDTYKIITLGPGLNITSRVTQPF